MILFSVLLYPFRVRGEGLPRKCVSMQGHTQKGFPFPRPTHPPFQNNFTSACSRIRNIPTLSCAVYYFRIYQILISECVTTNSLLFLSRSFLLIPPAPAFQRCFYSRSRMGNRGSLLHNVMPRSKNRRDISF